MVNKQLQGRKGGFRERGRNPEVLWGAPTVEETHKRDGEKRKLGFSWEMRNQADLEQVLMVAGLKLLL